METHHKWIVTFLIIVLLIMIFYQIWVIVWGANVVDSISVAENASGFCVANNTIFCTFSPNDALFNEFPNNITTFSTTNALMMGDLVGRIETQDFASPPSLELVNFLQPSNSFVFCGVWKRISDTNEKVLFIAFRGTKTEAEWEQDARVAQVPLGSGQVHEGFLSMSELFQSNLIDIITTEQPDAILIGGHSLGGAVATLFGYQLQISFITTPFSVYTFASPRVGNTEFATSVNFALFRVVNTNDLVNDIPLAVMVNFDGDHTPWIYQHTGTSYNFTQNWGSWKNNHLIPIYLNALTSCLLQTMNFNVCPNP